MSIGIVWRRKKIILFAKLSPKPQSKPSWGLILALLSFIPATLARESKVKTQIYTKEQL